jgi:hypothetical protein
MATAAGLVFRHGEDAVQAWISAPFNMIDLEKNPSTAAARTSACKDGLEQKQKGHSAAPIWVDPDWSILDDRRGELPDFPIDTFTEPWQEWLQRAAHGAGVTTGHVAVPLLGVTSSLIGTARRVRASRSWSEPMTLWACVVATSGDRKTPGLNVTLRALNLIEKGNSAAINVARLAHETRIQKSKEAHKKWKDERQAALDAKPPREPPSMPIDAIDPGDFISPRLYATDPTRKSCAPSSGKAARHDTYS